MVAWIDFEVEDKVLVIAFASPTEGLEEEVEEEEDAVGDEEEEDEEEEEEEEEEEVEESDEGPRLLLAFFLGLGFCVLFSFLDFLCTLALLFSRPLSSIILAPTTSPASALVTARSTITSGSAVHEPPSVSFKRSRIVFSLLHLPSSRSPRRLSCLWTLAIFAS